MLKTTHNWAGLEQDDMDNTMIDMTYELQNTEIENKNDKLGYLPTSLGNLPTSSAQHYGSLDRTLSGPGMSDNLANIQEGSSVIFSVAIASH